MRWFLDRWPADDKQGPSRTCLLFAFCPPLVALVRVFYDGCIIATRCLTSGTCGHVCWLIGPLNGFAPHRVQGVMFYPCRVLGTDLRIGFLRPCLVDSEVNDYWLVPHHLVVMVINTLLLSYIDSFRVYVSFCSDWRQQLCSEYIDRSIG